MHWPQAHPLRGACDPCALHRISPRRASVRSRQVSHREFDLTVGKLPPVFDHCHVSGLRKLIEDFAGFQTRRIDRKREYLRLPNAGHSGRQIMGASAHVTAPLLYCRFRSSWTRGREIKERATVPIRLSPLITGLPPARKQISSSCAARDRSRDISSAWVTDPSGRGRVPFSHP